MSKGPIQVRRKTDCKMSIEHIYMENAPLEVIIVPLV
jgi:hypothetical protein